jgi:hypothetical protein
VFGEKGSGRRPRFLGGGAEGEKAVQMLEMKA